jgi:RNA:NAD 2'-phosphotransferase (TPT1/KptA family)
MQLPQNDTKGATIRAASGHRSEARMPLVAASPQDRSVQFLEDI